MKENVLLESSKKFAVEISLFAKSGEFDRKDDILITQLLRSGTSIGANIYEGNYAVSKADFINKFQIALKECYETEYWLEIIKEIGIINLEKYNKFITQCKKIRKLLTTSLSTAKGKL